MVEIADGLLQRETHALLHSSAFVSSIDAWAFAAAESMAAVAGVELLRGCGIEPLAISGVIAMSPLGMREAADRSGVACLTGAEIGRGALNEELSRAARRRVPVSP